MLLDFFVVFLTSPRLVLVNSCNMQITSHFFNHTTYNWWMNREMGGSGWNEKW